MKGVAYVVFWFLGFFVVVDSLFLVWGFDLLGVFMQDNGYKSNFFLLNVNIHSLQKHLMRMLFSPDYVFGVFVKPQRVTVTHTHFLLHWPICLFLRQYHTVFITMAL